MNSVWLMTPLVLLAEIWKQFVPFYFFFLFYLFLFSHVLLNSYTGYRTCLLPFIKVAVFLNFWLLPHKFQMYSDFLSSCYGHFDYTIPRAFSFCPNEGISESRNYLLLLYYFIFEFHCVVSFLHLFMLTLSLVYGNM